MSRRRSPVRLLLAALLLSTCGADQPPEPPEPPAALDTLDAPIREQYLERRHALDEALAGGDEKTLAEAFGELGEWYHVYGFYGGARRAYGAALELEADAPRWLYFLAHVERIEGDEESAADRLDRVLALEPENVAAAVQRAELAFEKGELESADAAFAAILARHPRCVRAIAGRAGIARQQGRFEEAARLYERALEIQPQATSLRYSLGLVYRRLGRRQRAREQLALAPAEKRHQVPTALDDPRLRQLESLRRGVLYHQSQGRQAFEAGELDTARHHFERAVAIDAGNTDALVNLALVHQRLGELEAAEEVTEEAVRQDPGSAKAHLQLGLLHIARGRAEEAKQSLRKAVELDPRLAIAQLNLAQLLRGQDLCDEALPHYARARELDPRLAAADHGEAICRLQLGRAGEAISLLRASRDRLPGQPKILLLLARALSTAPAAALRDGEQALALVDGVMAGGSSVHLAETRAMALAELGRFDEAVAWQRAAWGAARAARLEASLPGLRPRIELYESDRPCRRAWLRGEIFSTLPVVPPAP